MIVPIVNIPYTQHNLDALQGAIKAGTRIICDGKEHFVKALTMFPPCGDIKVHLEPVVYPAETTEKEYVPKKPIGEEYSNDRFSGGWDCSDEEYNYSAYVRDVLNAGW